MANLGIDFHCDTLSKALLQGALVRSNSSWQLDLARLGQVGIGLQVFAIYTAKSARPLHDCLASIGVFQDAVQNGFVQPVLYGRDVDTVAGGDVPGGLLSLEGCEPLGGDVRILDVLFGLGVRAAGLTWNFRNQLADGVGESASKGGLTDTGRCVVRRMNQLGMVVDVSHISEAGFWDVAETCQGPFIASHSNARFVCDHPRNLTDAQMRAIAAAGGVIGLNYYPLFLIKEGSATIENILCHADHMLEIVGPAHIGLGSDFDGISVTPRDLSDVSAYPQLFAALDKRYGTSIAQAITGGNFARLLKNVLPAQP